MDLRLRKVEERNHKSRDVSAHQDTPRRVLTEVAGRPGGDTTTGPVERARVPTDRPNGRKVVQGHCQAARSASAAAMDAAKLDSC